MGKKEEREKERALAEIDRKFNQPEYRGERFFAFIGIVCAGIIVALSILQVYEKMKTVEAYGRQYSYADRVRAASDAGSFNPLATFAPIFWCLSAV
jgi:hypothetical protein